MILLTALLLAQPAPSPTAEAADSEDRIVVVAERMRSIDVNVGRDPEGNWHCSLSESSGSAWVDDRLCRITTGCVRDARGDEDRIVSCATRRRASIMDEFREALERGEA